MNKYIKELFLVGVIIASTAVVAYAGSDTAYDYQEDRLSITDNQELENTQELTVLVVKGDCTGTNPTFLGDAVYYIDQESGSSFNCFQNLGLKRSELEAGVYTLVVGGENVPYPRKELMIIGDVDVVPDDLTSKDLVFGTVSDVNTIGADDGKYKYVCVCSFAENAVNDPSKMGVIFQRKSGDKWQHMYMPLSLDSGAVINAPVKFGLQVNGITADPDVIQFSAVPYAETVAAQ